ANAAKATGDPDHSISAIDVRGVGSPLPAPGKATPNFAWTAGGSTVPGAAGQVAGVDAPGTYADRNFTIAADESDRSATIKVSWTDGTQDWELVVFRNDGGPPTEVRSPPGGPHTTTAQV